MAGPAIEKNTGIDLGSDPDPQLYELAEDNGERRNLAVEHPGVVCSLAVRLEKILRDGRSRRG